MTQNQKRISLTRNLTVTGVFSALSAILMMLSFSVPLMPSFVKFDFSELPALLVSYALGPVQGAAVCLIKSLLNLPLSTTGGVGELCNFLLGCIFVVPAGIIYRRHRNRAYALMGAFSGAVMMSVFGIILNYKIVYPLYAKIIPVEEIIAAYQAIFPGVNGLLSCLIMFNLPFTLIKGLADTALTFLLYKHLSPILKGKEKE